jgi:hypothetical protein
MPSERKLNVSLSMKIKSESTSVKVLPFNVAVLIHSFVNGSHGDTLPEVNCNRYLPSKFAPKIRHVILIGIRAEGTKYDINIKM